MKNILYIIAIGITLTFSSCSTEASFYDTLDIEESDQLFGGSITDIQTLIGQEAYDALTRDLGITIFPGDNPPNLNGSYNIFKLLKTHDLDPSDPSIGTIFEDQYIKVSLSNQNNETLTIDYNGEFFLTQFTGGDPSPTGDISFLNEASIGDVFVTGETSSDGTGGFTIFVTVTVGDDPSFDNFDTVALSGIRTATGIANLTYAYVSYEGGTSETGPIEFGETWTDELGDSPSL